MFEDVEVPAGQFRVEADFGAALPANLEPWLELAVRDGAGTTGQVLTSNGTGAPPAWESAAAGCPCVATTPPR